MFGLVRPPPGGWLLSGTICARALLRPLDLLVFEVDIGVLWLNSRMKKKEEVQLCQSMK